MTQQTESRTAMAELIALLQDIDARWISEEWNLFGPEDVSGAHRALMHLLEGGINGFFENDPSAPVIKRIVTPWRKYTGDNGDAIYFDAPVSAEYAYRVRGTTEGAVYISITLEAGTEDGSLGTKTVGIINDRDMDIDENGQFEIFLGGEPRDTNWLPLPGDASRLTTRHYFEESHCVAADPFREPRFAIEVLGDNPPPSPPNDASIAAGIRRAGEFIKTRTLGMLPMAQREQPAFVSIVPNEFPQPVLPGDFGLAARDAHYAMAPYFLGPDEALAMTGRWPDCRCANVDLWTRFQQTYDYNNRQVTLNRAQTRLLEDGSFRIIVAHQDPGLPNWLDTEGRPMGLVFWRFMLAEGVIECPQANVVPFDELVKRFG